MNSQNNGNGMALKCQFASDNTSGLCPEIWQALQQANDGYQLPYGDDSFTARASEMFRDIFETNCDIYFVFNGTAANSLALASLCQSYHSVITHESAHVETDECGGPEFFSNGTKLLLAPGKNGKLDPLAVEAVATKRCDIHFPRPKVISVTQPTELGTVYSVDELREIGWIAKKHGMRVHMDGARFGNAVVSLGVLPKAVTWQAGVDVLSFGGTKTGGFSEAVVFFDRDLSAEFAYRCKQAGQLASKMRFLAAPWTATLKNDVWLKHAKHANQCARLLIEKLSGISGIRALYPVQANSVFLEMPHHVHQALKQKGWHYYLFIGGAARFMCSWATTVQDVDELAHDIGQAAAAG